MLMMMMENGMMMTTMWDLRQFDCYLKVVVVVVIDPLTPTFVSSVFAVAGPLEVRTVRQKHPERNQF
jgi:hypothetical protein